MAKFDWNEIIVTHDGNIVNAQTKERMILVTGDKGDSGKDGRGIAQIKQTGRVGNFVIYSITYTDGTKSNFSLEIPSSGSGNGNFDTDMIAEQFNVSKSYSAGDYVIHNGKLYQFTRDHMASPWIEEDMDEADYEEASITKYFVDYWHLNENLISPVTIAPLFNEETEYFSGDYVMYNGRLYCFYNHHFPGEWKGSGQWQDVNEVSVTNYFVDHAHLNGTLINPSSIAPVFDEETAYNSGDYVIYNGLLYQFTRDHQPGAWITNHQLIDYQQVSVTNYFVDYAHMNGALINPSSIAPVFNEETAYRSGDYVIYNGMLYQFTQDHPAGEWITNSQLIDYQEVTAMNVVANDKETIHLKPWIMTLAGYFQNDQNYELGDYVTYEGYLYKFTSTHTAGAWNVNDVVEVSVMDELGEGGSLLGILAGAYSVYVEDPNISHLYKAGDYVLHKDQLNTWKLYRFIRDHRGVWSFTDVEEVMSMTDLTALNNRIGVLYFDETANYAVGDVVIYDNKLYKFLLSHTAGEWDNSHVTEITLIDLFNDKIGNSVIADNFSVNQNYEVGDYAFYNGRLYCFIQDHTAGEWDSSDVRETNILYEIRQLGLDTNLASKFKEIQNYEKGDYVIYNNILYQFNQDHLAGVWDSSHVTRVALADGVTDLANTVNSVNNSLNHKADNSLIAPEFNTSLNYSAGDYVIYQGYLRKFTSDHTAGMWNNLHARTATITEYVIDTGHIGSATSDRAHATSIAPEFNENLTYNVGDRVQKEGILYEFVYPHSGEWDSNDVVTRNIADILSTDEVKLNRSASKSMIAYDFNSEQQYSAGDYVIYNDNLYKFAQDHLGAWDENHATLTRVMSEIDSDSGGSGVEVDAIARTFQENRNYKQYDYVMYGGYLWQFLYPHPAGAWNFSHVTKVSIIDNFVDNRKVIDLLDSRAYKTSIAPEFDVQSTYNVGERVQRNGVLYEFIARHSGEWDSRDVITRNISDIIRYDEAKLANRAAEWLVASKFQDYEMYQEGDYVVYNDHLYRFNTAHNPGDWDNSEVTLVNVGNELKDMQDGISDVISSEVSEIIGNLGELAYKDDVPVDDKLYFRRNKSWYELGSAQNVTIYVDGINGSDDNTGGYGHPFATIGKAMDNLSPLGETTIRITAGTYNEMLSIYKKNVRIVIEGDVAFSDAQITESTVEFDYGNDYGNTFTFNGYIYITDRSNVTFNTAKVTIDNQSSGSAVQVSKNSRLLFTDTTSSSIVVIRINENSLNEGVIADRNSFVYLPYVNITAHIGIKATSGAVVSYYTLSGTMLFKTETSSGGRVYTGSQILEPPQDGKIYGRKNSGWAEISSGKMETYYVSAATGSDNNNGSLENPFATIQKAVQTISNGYINVYVGTYSGNNITIRDKNVRFRLIGDVTIGFQINIKHSNVSFSGTMEYDSPVERTLTFTSGALLQAEDYSDVSFDYVLVNTASGISISGSNCISDRKFTISGNNLTTGLTISNNSRVYFDELNITANRSYLVQSGSVLGFRKLIENTQSANLTWNGGRVYTGAQPTLGTISSQDDVSGNDLYGRSEGQWNLLTDTFYTEDEIDSKLSRKQDIVLENLSGSSIEFVNERINSIVKCDLNIEPSQDTHGYEPCTSGINLLEPLQSRTGNNYSLTVDAYGTCTLSTTGNVELSFITDSFELDEGLYTISMNNTSSLSVIQFFLKDKSTGNIIESIKSKSVILSSYSVNYNHTFRLNSAKELYFDVYIDVGTVTDYKFALMIESGNIHKSYKPYIGNICPITGHTGCNFTVNGTVNAISWQTEAGTVYKGSLDVRSGLLTVTWAEIASYAGESLPGQWISDRDVYEAGATPTIGAQVVYELATPVVYQLTPTEISTVVGSNTFSADTGNIHIVCFQDAALQDYIDGKDDALQNQINNLNSFEFHVCISGEYDSTTLIPTISDPDENTFYLVPNGTGNDIYDEYIYTNGSWEKFGSSRIDLSDYATTSALTAGLATKQNTLTFDTTPTASSTNPVTSGGIKTSLNSKADVITSTVSGNPVTITDGSPAPVADLTVGIEPVQDLHGYDHPYPAGGGKNLLRCSQINTSSGTFAGGISWTKNSDGSFTLNGTATATENLTLKSSADYSFPSGDYIINGCPSGGGNTLYRLVVNINNSQSFGTDTGSGSPVISLAEGDTTSVYIRVNSGVTISNKTFYPMLRLSDQPDTYEPYSNICPITGWTGVSISHSGADPSDPETVSVTFPAEAGTVYGGSLDVTAGVLKVTHGIIDIGDLTWTYDSSNTRFRSFISAILLTGSARTTKFVTSCFVSIHDGRSLNDVPNNAIYAAGASSAIYIKTTDYTAAASFVSAFTGQKIVYPLATPVTCQLTPTEVSMLYGQNTFLADTGAVTAEYRADTKLYIDGKIAEAEARRAESMRATRSLLAGIETEMVATKNYSIGDLLIVGDTLYKVTANIANEGSITVGTNVTATTVAEQLILLANA